MEYSKLTPMMQQYMKVKDKYQDTILLYRLGDFYEMFFDDAITASKVLEIALTGRNAGLEERVPMCGVPFHSCEPYIKKLIDNGYKVAICEQLEEPKAGKKIVKRDVVKIITPGTALILDNNDYNYIMFIDNSKPNYYYLSLCDLSTGKLKALTITKDKTKLYNEIKNYNIKEVVVDDKFDTSLFNELIKSYKLVISFTNHNNDYKNVIIDSIELDYQDAFRNLLFYIETMQMEKLDYFMEVEYLTNDNMKLDFSSKFNLELTSTIKNNDKYGTLFWYLDKTKTAMGSRLLKEYIENPLVNKEIIIKRQEFVKAMLDNFIETELITNDLKEVYDIARIAAKIGAKTVNPKELLWLNNSLKKAQSIVSKLSQINNEIINNYVISLDLVSELEEMISHTICIEILDGDNERIINNDVDDLLDQYRETLNDSTTWLVNFETRQKELTKIKNLKVKYNKVFGYYIEVSNGNKHLVKDEYGYIRKQTLTNAERYINNELKEQESLILNAQENVTKLEQEIYLNFKQTIHQYTERLQKLAKDLAYLDVICSFAKISGQYGFSCPTFNDESIIEINESFHPIIKAIDNDNDFINNDFNIDKDTNVLLITGPNMGGKSTYMRQLALIVIMAQIGCFVPASKANLMIFDQIFTRIGASDDLVKGQSTFMVEMLEASNAILNATENSLIIFDEIGRGTATYDGMAIACAMLEYLSSQKEAKLLFSTHYHELVDLEKTNPKIKNYHASVLEKENEITFTYKIKEGSIDKSYGIHVAKLTNLPEAIIKRSYQLLASFEQEHITEINTAQYIEVETNKYENVVKMIKDIDVNELSPVNALLMLETLQKKVNEQDE
ncbi:DNA mismatch repair protein MutS [Bacilli bacterium PM5-3]|nr:DNA mismatch repair protein MutS [Bacilli bacterium PM5-3]MDH6603880.1 DNA mismatch repair protein MutS [Bacilli bacterium PM5-9]